MADGWLAVRFSSPTGWDNRFSPLSWSIFYNPKISKHMQLRGYNIITSSGVPLIHQGHSAITYDWCFCQTGQHVHGWDITALGWLNWCTSPTMMTLWLSRSGQASVSIDWSLIDNANPPHHSCHIKTLKTCYHRHRLPQPGPLRSMFRSGVRSIVISLPHMAGQVAVVLTGQVSNVEGPTVQWVIYHPLQSQDCLSLWPATYQMGSRHRPPYWSLP